jgi:hypothetical protein
VLVAGAGTSAVAQAAAQVAGVSKVLHADSPALAGQLAENVAAQVLAVASGYSHLFFPATAHGKNVAPRVAATLDVGQLSDISKVLSADTFERPIYAGNAIATVQCTQAVKVATVRTTGFDPAAATGGSAAVESVACGRRLGQERVRRQGDREERPPGADRREDHRLGRPRDGLEREVHGSADAAGRQARRRDRREPRRVDAGLRAQRPAGGPDRQDRRARSSTSPAASRARSSTWPA